MPTLRRSVFNPAGSWETDPFDQQEAHAQELEQRRRDAAQARLDLLADRGREDGWRMASLREQGRQFDATRGDARDVRGDMLKARLAELDFAREGRTAESDRWGKQFDYLRGRDEREDGWRREQWGADKAGRDAQNSVLTAQSQATLAFLKRMEEDAKRREAAAAAAPVKDLTEEERADQAAEIAAGGNQAGANAAVLEKRRERAREDAALIENALKRDLTRYARKAGSSWWKTSIAGNILTRGLSHFFAEDAPASTEADLIKTRFTELRDRLIGAGVSRSQAEQRARDAIEDTLEKLRDEGYGENDSGVKPKVRAVLEALGMR